MARNSRRQSSTQFDKLFPFSDNANKGALSDSLESSFYMNLQNNLSRALRCALAAVGTFLVIDNGYVVLHVNCIELTLFGTQGTCDTACITFRLNVFALVVGRTLYQMFCGIRNQLDQVVRT